MGGGRMLSLIMPGALVAEDTEVHDVGGLATAICPCRTFFIRRTGTEEPEAAPDQVRHYVGE